MVVLQTTQYRSTFFIESSIGLVGIRIFSVKTAFTIYRPMVFLFFFFSLFEKNRSLRDTSVKGVRIKNRNAIYWKHQLARVLSFSFSKLWQLCREQRSTKFYFKTPCCLYCSPYSFGILKTRSNFMFTVNLCIDIRI